MILEPGRRVLVVDDDPLVRAALEQIFQRSGVSVWCCASGRAGLVEAQRVFADLYLIDVFLPDVNGVQLIEELRRRPEARQAGVVAMSARNDPQILVSAFAAGADDFIFKPVSGEELLVRGGLAIRRRREGAAQEQRGSERRDVSALFCDVRGFTAVAGRMDPEWVVELLNGLFDHLVEDLTRYGGQVDKYLGDGLLAFFGLEAGEGGYELRAIKAALAMIQSADRYSAESLVLEGRRLGVGVGIASGEVVIAAVGGKGRRQVTAIGDSVNLASRLQAIAGEGEVLICNRTFARVAHGVETGPGREVQLKGIAGTPMVFPVAAVRGDGE